MRLVPDTPTLREAVQLACRAPSVHNSQPWRWRAERGVLRLMVDRERLVPGTDRSGREAILSCGAALDHLRIAMLAAGWKSDIDRLPDPKDRDLLATIDFQPAYHVGKLQRDRASAILRRRTDRLPMSQPTYWSVFEPFLRNAIDDDTVRLDVLADETRPQLVEVSRLTEVFRNGDATYHLELDWWTAPFAAAQGVPPTALAEPAGLTDLARQFPPRGAGQRSAVATDWSKILVLSTRHDTVTDVLRCGETLSTVLLECTMAYLATCPLTHLIEFEDSRDVVRGLLPDRGHPQVLIRAGIAPPLQVTPPPTPRRPVDDVLTFT